MNEAAEKTTTALAVPQQRRDLSGVSLSTASVFDANDSFELGWRMASALASSSNLPEAYCQFIQKNGQWIDNPAAKGNCLIAIELANRLHLSPLMVIQNMHMVKGKPGFPGAFIIALINSARGPDNQLLFKRLQFDWKGDPTKFGPGWGVRARSIENATGDALVGVWITYEMVKGEGWLSNTKWTNMTEQMGMYRAASFWGRVFAPDIILGLHERGELEDIEGEFTHVQPTGARAARLNSRLDDIDHDDDKPTTGSDAGVTSASDGGGDPVLKDKPARKPRRTKAQIEADERAAKKEPGAALEAEPLTAVHGSEPESEDDEEGQEGGDAGQPDHEHQAPAQDPAQPASGGNLFNVE